MTPARPSVARPAWPLVALAAAALSGAVVAQRAPAASDDAASSTSAPAATGPREPGLALRVYLVDQPMGRLPRLVEGQTPNVSRVVPRLALEGAADFGLSDRFLTVVTGWLEAPVDGVYGFRLTSDDGSLLRLGGEVVVDHDGLHGMVPAEGEVELRAGWHALEVRHFENLGGEGLRLAWRPPGRDDFELVPASALSCPAGEVRPTSPGAKAALLAEEALVPGDGAPLAGVHPRFDLVEIRPEGFEPRVGGMDWLSDGRLVLCTWDADGSVWILDGVTGDDPAAVSVQRFAAGLAEPLGLCVVEDRILVLQKQELTELIDHDGDGVADEYRALASGWDVTANFHEFAFGLVHRDGHVWANLAIAIDPGGASTKGQVDDRGSTIRIDLADGTYERVATGLRTPNGIGPGPGGEILLTDNQGDWLPASKLLRLQDGAFYGSHAVRPDLTLDREVTPPVAWLPHGEIGNSPSQPVVVPPGHGPYSGQVLVGDVTQGGVKRVAIDEVDGVWQGTVFRFTQGLEAGVNRLSWGPDGALYVGGIGSTGNWGQTGKSWFGLQRLTDAGRPVFEMRHVRAMTGGLEIELTEPLAEGLGWEPDAYRVRQWRYEPTSDYGGPKIDEAGLPVRAVSVSPDRHRVALAVDGLAAGHVVHVHLVQPLESEEGRLPWSTEAWTTLNRLPERRPLRLRERPAEGPQNVLSAAERADGWELLFNGYTLEGWTGYGRDEPPEGWIVEDGCLVRDGPGGDLVTAGVYEDFELALEWRIAPGGNSGVFFHVEDGSDHVWESGPEMQVLDDDRHPDGEDPRTSAGANYALHAAPPDVTRPVGLFNTVRLRVAGGHVQQWLNGVLCADYVLGSPEWEERVAASKFAAMPRYGRAGKGRIALQDHGDRVWFRNIRVRRLQGR